ncbi:MAG: glycosyltransferase [Actinobacteria bacterium]|nr:MAG: glycosyltransferase [Actinomycetota bacterium]
MTAGLTLPHRVLFAVTSVVDLEHIAAHVDHLLQQGWLVDVMVCEGAPGTLFPHAAVHSIDLRQGHGPIAEARALQRTTALIRDLRPDVVVAATSAAAPLALTAARAARVRHRIYWIWSHDPLAGGGDGPRTRRMRRRAAESAASRAATVTLAASPALADDVATRAEQRPLVLGYGSVAGVDLDIFYPAEEMPAASPTDPIPGDQAAQPTALILGPLSSHRGLDLLTEVWPQVTARIPTARLLIAGEPDPRDPPGPVLDFLAGRPGVQLVGDDDTAAQLLRRAQVLLVTDPHGAPGADQVLEAAATGVPAVAWDQPANKDVISADSTGILCPPGDVGAYSEAVAQLLGDAELNRRMAVAARAFVAQRYDSTVVVELLAELLAGLVAAGAPEPPAAPAEINLSDGHRRRARR